MFIVCLERNEKDFLTAYRGHMLKVQKELEFFKSKFNEQDLRQKMDERVKNLEWFKNEALSLGKQMNQYKVEVEKWKARCNNLEYDNSFLEKQVINTRRQNKCLKIALGKSQSHVEQLINEVKARPDLASGITKDLLVVGKGGTITLEEKLLLKGAGELTKYSFTPQSPISESGRRKPPQSATSHSSQNPLKVYESKPRAFVEYLAELKLNKDEFCSELEKYLSKQESRFQAVITNVKNLLEKEKGKNRKLRHIQAKKGAEMNAKTEMLSYFQGNIHDPFEAKIGNKVNQPRKPSTAATKSKF